MFPICDHRNPDFTFQFHFQLFMRKYGPSSYSHRRVELESPSGIIFIEKMPASDNVSIPFLGYICSHLTAPRAFWRSFGAHIVITRTQSKSSDSLTQTNGYRPSMVHFSATPTYHNRRLKYPLKQLLIQVKVQ